MAKRVLLPIKMDQEKIAKLVQLVNLLANINYSFVPRKDMLFADSTKHQ
jgi:hypothetical protein